MANNFSINQFIFCSRKRCDCFSQHTERLYMKRNFSGFGTEKTTLGFDIVTDIKQVLKLLQTHFSYIINAEEKLDSRCTVFNMNERNFAHQTHGTNTTNQGGIDWFFLSILLSFLKSLDSFQIAVCLIYSGRVRFNSFTAHFFNFLKSNFLYFISFHQFRYLSV